MVLKKVKENILLILSIVLAIFAIYPLFHSGLFPMHDNEQVGRLFDFNNALLAGQFPVRIIQDLGFGYGYLLFNFYPPFVYYFGEIFKLLNFSYINSIKLVMGFGFIFSAAFMYVFVKEMYGKTSGLVSSVFYTYAPYHSVDIYVRGALPEFFSFVFVPAIFWSYLKMSQDNSKKYVVLASIFDFLLVITHNLVALMASVFIGVYILFLMTRIKDKKRFLINVSLTLVFSILLSSFFIFPALLENKYTMVSLLTTQLANYNIHFVCPMQFWNSPWGYGGSVAGCVDGLSFKLGKLHIIFSAAAILLALYFWFKKEKHKEVILFFLMLLVSLFMQIDYSKFIWDKIQALSYIQFPWRYLLFSAFFSSILVGFVAFGIEKYKAGKILLIVVIAYLIYLSIPIFKPQTYLNNTDNYYLNNSFLDWTTSSMSFEYVPKGIAMKTSALGNSIPQISEGQIAKTPFEVNSGEMMVNTVVDIPQRKEMIIDVNKPGELTLNEFAYPGWEVLVDNKKVDFNSNNKLKLISINLPVGHHTLEARFENTPLRSISNFLSLLGIIVMVIFLLPLKKYVKS